jgi:NADH:ubiquinone oxidoreductase subunit 4 (subunit M)
MGTVYSLKFSEIFHGNKNKEWKFNDMTWREVIIMGSLVIAIAWLGWYPQPVIDFVKPAINSVLEQMSAIGN